MKAETLGWWYRSWLVRLVVSYRAHRQTWQHVETATRRWALAAAWRVTTHSRRWRIRRWLRVHVAYPLLTDAEREWIDEGARSWAEDVLRVD